MDNSDETITIGRVVNSDLPASSWIGNGLADTETETSSAADAAAGLASLSFITTAIRRRTRFWCLAAVIGLLLGAGLYMAHPPPYQATVVVVLTNGPNEDLTTAIETDAALAESRPVAAIALQKLGVGESVSGLLASYTAVALTNRVLLITVSAPSSGEAVRLANDLATAFLQFRDDQLRSYERLVSDSLNQGIAQGKARVASAASQVNKSSGHATSPTQTTKLGGLQTELSRAKSTLSALEQSAQTNRQGTQVGTDVAVKDSYANSAALVVHSRVKTGVIYALTGLIAGLVLGLGFIAIQALVSDRLRQRDQIAHALGASVRLSVGRVRLHRVLPGRRGLAAVGTSDVQRIVGHLRGVLPDSSGCAALAVVPSDQPEVAALAVVALALSYAKQDKQVIIADLCKDTPAARLLGARNPGVHAVDVQDTYVVVAVPERCDAVPIGPLTPTEAPAQPMSPTADLAAAYSSSDVLLTLVPLDPMLGAEHLTTWSADVVVMVTAGRSSWTRVQAVGEMIRLGGARLVSAVLVGADKTDESLGVTHSPRAGHRADAIERDFRPPAEGPLVAVNGGSGVTVNGASDEAPTGDQ